MPTALEFDSRERLDAFLDALQQVVDRHDIYRTVARVGGPAGAGAGGVAPWNCRSMEVTLDPASGDPVAALVALGGPSMDLGRAAADRIAHRGGPGDGRWLALLRMHHMVRTTRRMDVLHGARSRRSSPGAARSSRSRCRSATSSPRPAAAWTAPNTSGTSPRLLADVHEPTAPYGMTDVRGDGADVRREILALAPVHWTHGCGRPRDVPA